MNNCIFCDYKKDNIIFENDLAYAKFDGFPVSKGHMLIITKRHVKTFFDTTKEERDEIMELFFQKQYFYFYFYFYFLVK